MIFLLPLLGAGAGAGPGVGASTPGAASFGIIILTGRR